eukprot:1196421-Prymnesium_polylepis.1
MPGPHGAQASAVQTQQYNTRSSPLCRPQPDGRSVPVALHATDIACDSAATAASIIRGAGQTSSCDPALRWHRRPSPSTAQ